MRAIVTFHTIDTYGSVLSYPPALFGAFVEALVASDLPVCDLDTLLRAETQRGVVLTFDDGMHSVFDNALPVIRAHAIPAHLFLTTGAVAGDNRWPSQPLHAPRIKMLDWPQIEALHKAGVAIESHTHNHPDLRLLDDVMLAEECRTADTLIERRLGRRPRYFAYPYGCSNPRIRDYARTNYRAGVTTELRVLHAQEDFAALPRLDSYYLRTPWVARDLESPATRAYLWFRGLLRQLRGNQ